MTIRLTEANIEEQFQSADEEALQFDPTDERDITFRRIQGWARRIDLREGIHLSIVQVDQATDRAIISDLGTESYHIYCSFLLSGNYQCRLASALGETAWTYAAGGYWLSGTGSRSQLTEDHDIKPRSEIILSIHERTFRSFAASPDGELPKSLQPLSIPVSQEIYRRIGKTQPAMTTVLQQILHCPYQGIVKRAYLESKVIELMALVLDDEMAIQQGDNKKDALKPEQLERVHYAREILLRDLSNPPTLEDLAHQVGLNDFLLKQGFHQAFGTTVFEVLQSYRMEIAQRLLVEGKTKVAEIGLLVGYASVSAFTRAFKRRFGMSPKAYQKKWTRKR